MPLLSSYTAHLRLISECSNGLEWELNSQASGLARLKLQDRPSRKRTAETPAQRVIHIQELLENILECLPGRDLIRLQRVCRQWKSTITSLAKFQPMTWTVPMACTSADAHFPVVHDPAHTHRKARLRQHQKYFFEDLQIKSASEAWSTYMEARSSLRRTIESSIIRRSGWDAKSLDGICAVCGCAHDQLDIDNMHPLLQWLVTHPWEPVCVSGYGSRIFVQLPRINSVNLTRRNLQENVYLGSPTVFNLRQGHVQGRVYPVSPIVKKLQDVRATMDRHRRGSDMFMAPICTALMIPDTRMVQDEKGITLQQAVLLLLEHYQS